jgi:hypothetical protein
MVQSKRSYLAGAAAIFALMALPSPGHAQAPPLDANALITPSLKVDTGIALARRQIGDNDLLGAVGTLERVLIANDDALPARLLYASLLCRLDDRQGAEVEISMLPKKKVPDANWAEVTGACGPMQRPGEKSKR